MEIFIYVVIGGLVGYIIGKTIKERKKADEVNNEEQAYEDYTLTEEDENKVVAYALKQLKYNQNELQISTYMPDSGSKFTDRNWRFYAFLDDLRISICINGVARWKSDTEVSLLTSCAEHFIKGDNPFEEVQIELRTDDEQIIIDDWKTIEKFIDILYDTYYKLTFHQFVSYKVEEKKRLDKFRRERKVEIYKKIGIDISK